MKKRILAIALILMSLVMVVSNANVATTTTNKSVVASDAGKTSENNSKVTKVTCKEVSIVDEPDEMTRASSMRLPLDLKEIITGEKSDKSYKFNTYVFSGKIISRKEFEFSWTDDQGEEWGPFPRAVLEVEITKEYHGGSPVKGNIIRVLYPYSLSDLFDDSVRIKDNSEYVFANCWVLDDKYTDYVKKYAPEDKFESEKYADVITGDSWNSLFPIDDGMVMAYHEFFDHDKEAKKQILPSDSISTDKLTSSDSLKSGYFTAMRKADFEEAFLRLFENPDKLPTIERDNESN